MVAVSPTPSDLQFFQRPVKRRVRVLKAAANWIVRVAGRLPGEYTIAKLDAYNQFRQDASAMGVLTIILSSAVPCFVTSLLIESIPLANPATGLWGSLHFQIRNYLTATIMTAMPVALKLNCIPQLSTNSWRFVLCYGMTTAGVAIANNALISIGARVFPVPFTQFAPTVPMALIGVLLNRFFLQKPEVQERAEKIDQWLAMDMVPICVYPVFTAVFMSLKPTQQLWVSLLLPVIKRLLRYVIWLVMRDDFDLVGPTTCSVSHLYHTLFTAMCLQNAKSVETLAAVVMVNTLQMLLNCRDILKDAEKLKRTQLMNNSSTFDDVVSTALEIATQHQVATLLHQKSPSRIVSKYPGYQTQSFQSKYHDLLLKTSPANTSTSTMDRSIRRSSRHRSQLTTKGESPPPVEQNFTQIIPWMRIYLAVVYWLPNRRYFATMSTLTTFEAVNSSLFHFLLLGGCELGFLVTYLILISYQLEVSGLRQLAFVLWSQRVLLQTKFISLSLMILGFPLEHYGNGIIYKLRTG